MTMTVTPRQHSRVTPRQVDFASIDMERTPVPHKPQRRDANGQALKMSKKQIRARARRNTEKAGEALRLLHKPIEEWDDEELARGRPRASDGSFSGRPPQWITRELHERAIDRFRQVVKDGMNAHTVHALEVIDHILANNDFDDKGKPVVPASTKLDAAKFLIEHVLGKPTQRVEGDISVKLQGILAAATVMPGTTQLPALAGSSDLASPREQHDLGMFDGITDAEWSVEVDDG